MNDAGDAGAWYLLCTLSLASCRLRAESLARHLHNKLWTAGRFEAAAMDSRQQASDVGENGSNMLIVDRAPQPSSLKYYHNQHRFANGHLWQNNLYSEDDDEIYEPASDSQVGSSPSPPIPADDDEELIVNSATGPGLIVSSHHRCSSEQLTNIGDNKEVLYEKLMQFADNNSFSDGDTSDTYYDVDSSSNSGDEDNVNIAKEVEDLDMTGMTRKFLPSESSFDSGLNECFDSGVNGLNGEQLDGTPLACSTPDTPPPSPPLTSPLPNGSCVTDDYSIELEPVPPTTEKAVVTNTCSELATTPPKEEPAPPSPGQTKFHVTPIDEQLHTAAISESKLSPDLQNEVEDLSSSKEEESEISEETPVTSRTDWFFLDHPNLRETLKSTLAIGEEIEDVEDEDDDASSREMQRTRLLRSTSLKTGKTPPGTPRRKKIVRFADALGLDLEAVRHIVSDDLPNIPASAFNDLHISDVTTTTTFCRAIVPPSAPSGISGKVLYPQFPQPVSDPCFMDRLRRQKVCLENVVVADLSLQCLVRVLNIGYEKSVVVRYTSNEWTSFQEVQASYVQASSDGYTDKFCVHLYASHLAPGQRLSFAIYYVVNGQEFWDNNFGHNYVLRCHSTTPTTLASCADDTASPWFYNFW